MNDPIKPRTVELRDVKRSFVQGDVRIEVLRGVNLDINANEIVALLGPSGSGKSTLLQAVGLLEGGFEGSIKLNGEETAQLPASGHTRIRRDLLGFVYQFHHLLPEFTALENVAMPMFIRGSSIKKAKERARLLLEKVGMVGRLDHKPSELSGGERQRTAIARALCAEPKCVLADEPTGNLDPATAEQVVDVIFKLNRDFHTSLVVVTHDMSLAERMDSIYTIEDGHLKKIK